jgi:hypothetical protein
VRWLSDALIGLAERKVNLKAGHDDEAIIMPIHVICPSLKCRKILSMPEDVRGSLVKCRYCEMEFRVPRINRSRAVVPAMVNESARAAAATSAARERFDPVATPFTVAPPFAQPR